jgi:hypothetical protein
MPTREKSPNEKQKVRPQQKASPLTKGKEKTETTKPIVPREVSREPVRKESKPDPTNPPEETPISRDDRRPRRIFREPRLPESGSYWNHVPLMAIINRSYSESGHRISKYEVVRFINQQKHLLDIQNLPDDIQLTGIAYAHRGLWYTREDILVDDIFISGKEIPPADFIHTKSHLYRVRKIDDNYHAEELIVTDYELKTLAFDPFGVLCVSTGEAVYYLAFSHDGSADLHTLADFGTADFGYPNIAYAPDGFLYTSFPTETGQLRLTNYKAEPPLEGEMTIDNPFSPLVSGN